MRQKYIWLRLIADIMIIPASVIIGYSLKFKVGWFFQHILSLQLGRIYQQAQIEPYIQELGVVTIIWVVTFYFVGLYRPFSGIMPEVDEWVGIVKAVTIATVELMAFTFIYKTFPESRFVLAYTWGVAIVLLITVRTVIYTMELNEIKTSHQSKRTLIIGHTEAAQDVIEKVLLFPTLGYRYIGSISGLPLTDLSFHLRNKVIHLGPIEKTGALLDQHKPDHVFVADPSITTVARDWCEANQVALMVLYPDSPIPTTMAQQSEFDGIPLTHFHPYHPPKQLIVKEIIDRVLAALGLIVLSPVLLSIAILIRQSSPDGPILFQQERVGRNGKVFKMLKFRTMIPNAEAQTGPIMVDSANESRYIKYGDFLRKTSLDELPQLWNVLKGEMSLVGPRPERPYFVDTFSKELPHFTLRHLVKGGITGWAQINGRSALTNRPDHKIKYDLYYIKNWSLSLDIKILLKTISIVCRREEAY